MSDDDKHDPWVRTIRDRDYYGGTLTLEHRYAEDESNDGSRWPEIVLDWRAYEGGRSIIELGPHELWPLLDAVAALISTLGVERLPERAPGPTLFGAPTWASMPMPPMMGSTGTFSEKPAEDSPPSTSP